MTRKILSIIAGYAVFGISSGLLFKISAQDPHGQATTNFQVFSAFYGAFFSFVGGIVVQLIAKTEKLTVNFILAFIIAGIATTALTLSEGTHWTEFFTIFIFSPLYILGGLFYNKKIKQK